MLLLFQKSVKPDSVFAFFTDFDNILGQHDGFIVHAWKFDEEETEENALGGLVDFHKGTRQKDWS